MRGSSSFAKSREAVTLTHLEFFDHAKTGVALLRQFDSGVRKVAATVVFADKSGGLVDKTIELGDRIPRSFSFDLGPNFV